MDIAVAAVAAFATCALVLPLAARSPLFLLNSSGLNPPKLVVAPGSSMEGSEGAAVEAAESVEEEGAAKSVGEDKLEKLE